MCWLLFIVTVVTYRQKLLRNNLSKMTWPPVVQKIAVGYCGHAKHGLSCLVIVPARVHTRTPVSVSALTKTAAAHKVID